MKIYNAKPKSKVELIDNEIYVPPGSPQFKKGDILRFHHIDGMYAYCYHKDYKSPVYIAAYTEVDYANEKL